MFITGIGTAFPMQAYKQSEGWEAVQVAPQFSSLTPRARAILRKVLTGNNGIDTRRLALDSLHDVFATGPDVLHARFARHAPRLAADAAARALHRSGLAPGRVDALIVSTCTGYLCPGLTSYVSELLGLRPDARLFDLVGQGCGAALPNLSAGAALLDSGQCAHVLSVCVEICSAAFYLDNDPGVLVSACLFGDGAGAAVLAAKPRPGGRAIEWKTFHTHLVPGDRDLLRFEQKNGMLRNILSPSVPALAATYAESVVGAALRDAGLGRDQVKTWIWHAGGRDVLLALQDRLGLTPEDMRWSATVLRDFGNVSSPSVYFVLAEALAGNAPNGWWWMSSFGAGFSCHGALLNVA